MCPAFRQVMNAITSVVSFLPKLLQTCQIAALINHNTNNIPATHSVLPDDNYATCLPIPFLEPPKLAGVA